MFYLVFATHVLLDSFTAYGTQIFWPLINTPMTWSTIFIIDPGYTLPLIVGVMVALLVGRRATYGHRVNQLGLLISSLYLGWTVAALLIILIGGIGTLSGALVGAAVFRLYPAAVS